MKTIKKFLYIMASGVLLSSCSKSYLDVKPESAINSDQLSTSPAATLGLLKGVLATLRSAQTTGYAGHEDYGHKGVLSVIDLMGNDVVMENLNWGGFNYDYTGRISTSSRAHFPWFTYYTQIKNVNTIINKVDENTEDQQLKAIRGQAIALRGYFHFMLARIYGPTYVGHTSEPSIPINASELSKKRNTVAEVYTQIVDDLKKGIEELEGYERPNKELIDKSVAQAFLADVYLEMGNYKDAAVEANAAKKGYQLLTEAGWKNGFYDISQNETMWGADLNPELTTYIATFFGLFDNTNEDGYSSGGNIAIDRRLYEAMSNTDFRKTMYAKSGGQSFTTPNASGQPVAQDYGSYISFKFRDLTPGRTSGDYIYLRSALLYYIEAEGLAKSGNEAGARDVLFEITSKRDPSYIKSAKSGQELIDEIILQKRIELWGEGFAWFDLKRLKLGVVRNYQGTNHPGYGRFNIPAGDNKFLFMIPQAEVDANPDVLPNNPQ